MRILRQLQSFASALLHRGRVDDEFRSEIDFHVSVYADDLMRQGVPRTEAERRARVEFGSVTGCARNAGRHGAWRCSTTCGAICDMASE